MGELKMTNEFFNDAFPFALGYWQGRSVGCFENGTYENMTDKQQNLYRIGYDAGVADYSEMDALNHEEIK
jgi:hypothetical protein